MDPKKHNRNSFQSNGVLRSFDPLSKTCHPQPLLFGKPATLNLCSKCYRSLQPNDGKSPLSLSSATSSPPLPTGTSPDPSPFSVVGSPTVEAVTEHQQGTGRCAGCKRKVGLTWFKCRYGSTFCVDHRYSEKHTCGYDYKAEGREEIARANPVVKAEKLRRS